MHASPRAAASRGERARADGSRRVDAVNARAGRSTPGRRTASVVARVTATARGGPARPSSRGGRPRAAGALVDQGAAVPRERRCSPVEPISAGARLRAPRPAARASERRHHDELLRMYKQTGLSRHDVAK
ncbi:MAG: hypothetical protein H6713_24995 [Myxococcales bacterium]|nr:hypothetical protein [Myxococcales bacterium]